MATTEDKTSASNISRRGFAALDAEQRKKIASMGGKAAHEKGTAHQFTSEEAAAAGRKRGQNMKKASAPSPVNPVSAGAESYAMR
ncbi:MAG TPA: KGG domain-containing protein [Oculatellaceae cyanobacterium]